MSKTMQAAVVRAFRQPLVVEELPIPTPGPGQVLVRVVASGVCHTDIHAANGDWPVKPRLPFIPGHEGAGYVAAVGHGVQSIREGDRVGVPWLHRACGRCEFCRSGWEMLCELQTVSGYTVNGAFADYVLAEEAFVAPLPDELEFAAAAPILCAGVTAYKGLMQTETRPGNWVVISGIGGPGHLAVQYARALGLRVAAVDISGEKLALARSLGADLTVNAAREDPARRIQLELGGAHGVLVTASSPGAFAQAVGMLRRHGTCVLVGLPPAQFPTPIFDVVLKCLTIRGSMVGTRAELADALRLAAEGQVRVAIERQPLSAVNRVFKRLERGDVQGRIVLDIMKETCTVPALDAPVSDDAVLVGT
jgi:propanol-preferring alcohol dehydrogenase